MPPMPRVSNMWVWRIRTAFYTNLRLAAFCTERAPKPLQPHERRFWLPTTELPPEVQATSMERKRRACILDENTEEAGAHTRALHRRGHVRLVQSLLPVHQDGH